MLHAVNSLQVLLFVEGGCFDCGVSGICVINSVVLLLYCCDLLCLIFVFDVCALCSVVRRALLTVDLFTFLVRLFCCFCWLV